MLGEYVPPLDSFCHDMLLFRHSIRYIVYCNIKNVCDILYFSYLLRQEQASPHSNCKFLELPATMFSSSSQYSLSIILSYCLFDIMYSYSSSSRNPICNIYYSLIQIELTLIRLVSVDSTFYSVFCVCYIILAKRLKIL